MQPVLYNDEIPSSAFDEIKKVFETPSWFNQKHYSSGEKKCYKYCFMKQKCQLQMGIALYKNAATPLSILGINTTHPHFQIKYATLF